MLLRVGDCSEEICGYGNILLNCDNVIGNCVFGEEQEEVEVRIEWLVWIFIFLFLCNVDFSLLGGGIQVVLWWQWFMLNIF